MHKVRLKDLGAYIFSFLKDFDNKDNFFSALLFISSHWMKIVVCDSIWPFFARNTAFRRDATDAQECRTISLSVKAVFRTDKLLYDIIETVLSINNHMVKFIWFRSGLVEGDMHLSQKPLALAPCTTSEKRVKCELEHHLGWRNNGCRMFFWFIRARHFPAFSYTQLCWPSILLPWTPWKIYSHQTLQLPVSLHLKSFGGESASVWLQGDH